MAWLLAIAMEAEAKLLMERLAPASALGGRTRFFGILAGQECHLILTGLGQVNAAQAVTVALERLADIQAVINLGCAGAYPDSGLTLGQAVVATEVIHADLGVATSRRWHPLDIVGIPLLRDPQGRPIFNRLPLDAALAAQMASANPGIPRGAVATVSQVSGDPATAAMLQDRWRASLEDMESAAVAQVAALYSIPCAVLRGVSNIAGDRHLDVAAGAHAAQRALLRLEEGTGGETLFSVSSCHCEER